MSGYIDLTWVSRMKAEYSLLVAENAELKVQLEEARAEIERLRAENAKLTEWVNRADHFRAVVIGSGDTGDMAINYGKGVTVVPGTAESVKGANDEKREERPT